MSFIKLLVQLLDNESIERYFDCNLVANLISKMLDSKDSSYILQVYSIIDIVMFKTPEKFRKSFIREGVADIIKNLIDLKTDDLFLSMTDTKQYFKRKIQYIQDLGLFKYESQLKDEIKIQNELKEEERLNKESLTIENQNKENEIAKSELTKEIITSDQKDLEDDLYSSDMDVDDVSNVEKDLKNYLSPLVEKKQYNINTDISPKTNNTFKSDKAQVIQNKEINSNFKNLLFNKVSEDEMIKITDYSNDIITDADDLKLKPLEGYSDKILKAEIDKKDSKLQFDLQKISNKGFFFNTSNSSSINEVDESNSYSIKPTIIKTYSNLEKIKDYENKEIMDNLKNKFSFSYKKTLEDYLNNQGFTPSYFERYSSLNNISLVSPYSKHLPLAKYNSLRFKSLMDGNGLINSKCEVYSKE